MKIRIPLLLVIVLLTLTACEQYRTLLPAGGSKMELSYTVGGDATGTSTVFVETERGQVSINAKSVTWYYDRKEEEVEYIIGKSSLPTTLAFSEIYVHLRASKKPAPPK